MYLQEDLVSPCLYLDIRIKQKNSSGSERAVSGQEDAATVKASARTLRQCWRLREASVGRVFTAHWSCQRAEARTLPRRVCAAPP